MIKIGIGGIALTMLSACGNGTPDYDATGTFEATEVIVSAEAAGKLLNLDIEEGKRLQTGEEIGLVDTLQLYLKKLQLEANMKSVESQRPDLAKQIAATKQQIATAEREKKRVENLLTAGAANQKQLDDWDAQVKLLERQLAAQESSLLNSTNSLTEQGNSVCQHPNPAFQAVQVGIKSAAWIACLTYNLWNPVNFAVLLAVWHCSVLVFDGIDSSEIHIHSQRVTDLFLEQFLPGLTGQTLTQVAQCNIHLVLVAVFFAETKCRREISDTANQICSVLPNKGSHDIVTA